MAGLFLSFSVDYLAHRLAHRFGKSRLESGTAGEDGIINVLVLEAGITFHSICEYQTIHFSKCITAY